MTESDPRSDRPRFPALPDQEYETRHRRAREAMDAAGLDLLLLSSRENVEYFTGYLSSHWFMVGFVPGVVLFPLLGEPCLIVPQFWAGTADAKSYVRDIVPHPKTHSNPGEFPDLVAEIIFKRGWSNSNIGYELGMEMTVGLPIEHFDRLRLLLDRAEWSSAGDVLWSLRRIKSELEIDLLGKAGAATCRALERVRDNIQAGMSEIEVGRLIRTYQAEEGCEDRQFLNVRCGPDRYAMTDTLPEDRRMQPGEMLILDVGMHRKDYWSDTARCISVGPPSGFFRSVYSTIVEAEHAALGVLQTGIPANHLYQAVRQVIDDAGYGVHVDMVGHGIGMSMYEPPMLSPVAEEELKSGMVLCIEPWITLPNNEGVFCLEDMVVVTDDGYEQLTPRNAEELWAI